MAAEPLAMCYPGPAGGISRGRLTPRFRTIQVCAKDRPVLRAKAESAGETGCTGWASHVRHETARFHYATRRHGGRVAACGARAAASDAGDWVP